MKRFVLVSGAKEQINKIFEKAGVTKKRNGKTSQYFCKRVSL